MARTSLLLNRVPGAILSSPLHPLLSGKRLVSVREPYVVAEALTALIRDHPPYGRWAHVRVGADGTPQAADVRAEVTRGRVLVRVQLPDDAVVP